MKKYPIWMVALLVAGLLTVAAPRPADAALRVGADALWVPLASQSLEGNGTDIDSDHDLASFGFSAHGNLGFDIFSLGLKLNYFNQGIDFASTDERLEELDVNLVARIGIPSTAVALFGEGGLTTNPGFDYAGYDLGGGVEYDVLGLPILDLNVGAMGQYVNVSEIDLSYGDSDATASLSEGRLMLFVGVDFSI